MIPKSFNGTTLNYDKALKEVLMKNLKIKETN